MHITKRMLNPSFRCIQFATFVCIFPVKLDYQQGKFSRYKSKLPIIMNIVVQFFCCCKMILYLYQTVRRLVDYEAGNLHLLLLNVVLISNTGTAMFWNYELFHRGLDETILLFNSLYFPPENHLIIGRKQKRIHRWLSLGKKMLKAFRHFSLLEVFVVMVPSINIPFTPNYVATAIMFPHFDLFITSVFPVHEWSTGLYLPVLGLESLVSAFVVLTNFFLFFFEMTVQVVHISAAAELVDEVKSHTTEEMDMPNEQLDTYTGKFMFYYSFISICNILYSRILYTGKIMSFTCSILGTFYFMTHLRTGEPMVLGFFLVLGVDAILLYVISCLQLFDVPALMASAKHSMSLIVGNNVANMTEEQRRYRKKQIRAIPALGISDGGFHVMESISILVFIDFYLNQVISLLLMWYEPA